MELGDGARNRGLIDGGETSVNSAYLGESWLTEVIVSDGGRELPS
jgi:hypothetical protein